MLTCGATFYTAAAAAAAAVAAVAAAAAAAAGRCWCSKVLTKTQNIYHHRQHPRPHRSSTACPTSRGCGWKLRRHTAVRTQTARYGLMDNARHVIGCQLTQKTQRFSQCKAVQCESEISVLWSAERVCSTKYSPSGLKGKVVDPRQTLSVAEQRTKVWNVDDDVAGILGQTLLQERGRRWGGAG